MFKPYGRKRHINESYEKKKNNKRQQSDNEHVSSPTDLRKCQVCDRYFNQNRLIEHEQACEKSNKLHLNSTDHYHYDSQLHRWKGLDYRQHANRANVKHTRSQSAIKQIPKTHWREQHRQFQDAMKGEYHPTDDVIQSTNDRPYQCPHCQRKFATENAVTKHQKGCTNNR